MTYQTAATGAKRRTQREFAAPMDAAREQQIRDVYADDDEDQSDSAEDGKKRRLDPACDLVVQRSHPELDVPSIRHRLLLCHHGTPEEVDLSRR